MIRVLQVTGSLRIGGLEKVAVNCMKYADLKLFQFDFLVYGESIGDYENELEKMGGRIIRIPSPSKGYWGFYRNVCAIIKDYGPYDIVHAHTFFNAGIIVRAAYASGVKKRIAHAHSVKRCGEQGVIKNIYNFIMRRWLIKYATIFCACSKQAGCYLFTPEIFEKVGVILPNIIDVDRYLFIDANRDSIRKELGIDAREIVIGQVGHLTEAKNQFFLLKLFQRYRKEKDATLVIAGDGELREELIIEANRLGIDKDVRFLGTRTDIGEILSAIDVFVCTSKNEGFGIVLLEAKANGLPCVIEENTLVEEIRELGYNFEVIGFENMEDWCDAVDRAYESGRSLEVVNNLKKSPYTKDKFSEALASIY